MHDLIWERSAFLWMKLYISEAQTVQYVSEFQLIDGTAQRVSGFRTFSKSSAEFSTTNVTEERIMQVEKGSHSLVT